MSEDGAVDIGWDVCGHRSVDVLPDDVIHHGKRKPDGQRNESTSKCEQPDHGALPDSD